MYKLGVVALLVACVAMTVFAAQEPLIIQNADEYRKITEDKSKITLVKVWATWCGHCKTLINPYIEVAQHFDGNDKVIIAKYDAPANEEHARNVLQIKSFPTIFLYKDGVQKTFSGTRDKAALIKFVEENL